MKKYTTTKEFLARPDIADWQAIVKPLSDGRHICLGFELKKKRSRRSAAKFYLRPPVILEEIEAAHKKRNESQPEAAPV